MLSFRALKLFLKQRRLDRQRNVFHNMRHYTVERAVLGLRLLSELPVSFEGKVSVRTPTLAVLEGRVKHYVEDLLFIGTSVRPVPTPLPSQFSTGSDYQRDVWLDIYLGDELALPQRLTSLAGLLDDLQSHWLDMDEDIKHQYRSRIDSVATQLGRILDQLL